MTNFNPTPPYRHARTIRGHLINIKFWQNLLLQYEEELSTIYYITPEEKDVILQYQDAIYYTNQLIAQAKREIRNAQTQEVDIIFQAVTCQL